MRQPAAALAVVVVVVRAFAELEAEGKEKAMDRPALLAAPQDDAVEVKLVDRAILDAGPGLEADGPRIGLRAGLFPLRLDPDVERLVGDAVSEGGGGGQLALARRAGLPL